MLKIISMLFTLGALLCACGTTDSDNIKTRGINAKFVVSSQGNRTDITSSLKVGSGGGSTDINLTSVDTLTATMNGVTRILSKSKDIFGDICYKTSFDDAAPGTEVVLALTRENDISAPYSHVNLPENLLITTPANGQSLLASTPIQINWEPFGISNSIYIETVSKCKSMSGSNLVVSQRDTVSDSGSVDLALRNLRNNSRIDLSQTCTLKITLKRTTSGILDPNYGEGGSISAKRISAVTVSLNP